MWAVPRPLTTMSKYSSWTHLSQLNPLNHSLLVRIFSSNFGHMSTSEKRKLCVQNVKPTNKWRRPVWVTKVLVTMSNIGKWMRSDQILFMQMCNKICKRQKHRVNRKTVQIPRYEPMQKTNPYRARGYKGERQSVSEMVRQHKTGYTWVSHKVYRMYCFTAIQYFWNL